MKVRRVDTAHLTPARRWVIQICLCLLAVMLLSQALHVHPNDFTQTDVKHCTVCQLAHAPIQATPIPHLTFGLARTAFLSLSADRHPKLVLASFSLFCRPPPLV
jgi:hypothetical protein